MIKVAILGSGNIGTDLLFKVLKTNFLELVVFVGRRYDSEGMKIAIDKNIRVSDKGINFFVENPNCCDIIFDCTNASDAKKNSLVFEKQNIKVIDLTPAKIGKMCVPAINGDLIFTEQNVNMITCGGQASIPLIHLISNNVKRIDYVEVVSQISANSAGLATRLNIDNYIKTTNEAIVEFSGCKNTKVILNLNPAQPCVDMQTTIFIKSDVSDLTVLTKKIKSKVVELQKYIPYYELIFDPKIKNNILTVSIKVKGLGDYLPPYAGNLDIINCAAIELTKILSLK